MEGIPNHELDRNQIIESLRQNSEDRSLLTKYVEEREKDFKESKEYLNLNVEVAEILRDAGMLDEAYDAFLDVRDQALQERDEELSQRMSDEAEKLRV